MSELSFPQSNELPQLSRSERAQRAYNRFTLAFYDLIVQRITNPFCWRCSTKSLVAWYDRHVSDNHLDVGVATGYLLDRCRFPSASPRVSLLDINAACLKRASCRIARYAPRCHLASVYEPLEGRIPDRFDSIGLNYVLHCLAGPWPVKHRVLANLRSLLRDGGTLFGSTVLGKDVPLNWPARRLLNHFNRLAIFDNADDSLDGLRRSLAELFSESEVVQEGAVALFAARR